MVRAIATAVDPYSPDVARWLLEAPWFQSGLAVLLTLLAIYTLGWAASRIVGHPMLPSLESLVARIPLVTKVYRTVASGEDC